MDYDLGGGYDRDGITYSIDGSTQNDEIISSSATDFTYEKVANT